MSGLTETHRYMAPGVWLPKATTPQCPETFGPWRCDCAKGHIGAHRNAHGEVIGPRVAVTDLGWHVITGELLLASLRRCADGSPPDLVYAELWANSEREADE